MLKILKKIGKYLLAVLLILWVGVLLFLHLGMVAYGEYKDKEMVLTAINLIAVWWAITGGIILVWIKFDEKIREKRAREIAKATKEYRDKYVTKLVIEDSKFGSLVFDKDSKLDRLEMVNSELPPFGNISPEDFSVNDYSESDGDLFFRNLEKVYHNEEIVLKNIHGYIKESCDDWDDKDKDGNPISIKYIEQNLEIFAIEMYKNKGDFIVSLHCSIDYELLGGHWIFADVNCTTMDIDYSLVG